MISSAQVVTAVLYCARGGKRPYDDEAFAAAEANGLLAHDPVWRATERGMGALIGAGLIAGEPAPEQSWVHILWTTSARYPRPQFVAAWPDGMVDCWHEMYLERRRTAEQQWREFDPDDGPWTFFMTTLGVGIPAVPGREPVKR